MLRCMSSAIAGLKANMIGMDVTGNNVSNVNTDSFKSSSVSFRDTMYQQINGGSANSANSAGINPSQIGYGATASSVDVDFTKGGKNATGNASDVYIDGDAFFVVGNSAKAADDTFTGEKYTRLGKLSTDSARYLTAGQGNYICGYAYDPGTKKYGSTVQAIQLPTPGAGKTIENTSIAPDGTITCDNGGTIVTVGKIALAKFPNASGLKQIGNSFYTATDNSGTVTYINPGTDSTNNLVTGSLEGSNVDLATEFSNMIMYERGYQANTKIVGVADEMLQTLVNMK